MVESGIQYKIVPDRIRDGPQIPDGISAGEWLREMPEFACDCQPSQWVITGTGRFYSRSKAKGDGQKLLRLSLIPMPASLDASFTAKFPFG
jgi:hypothetical protein